MTCQHGVTTSSEGSLTDKLGEKVRALQRPCVLRRNIPSLQAEFERVRSEIV